MHERIFQHDDFIRMLEVAKEALPEMGRSSSAACMLLGIPLDTYNKAYMEDRLPEEGWKLLKLMTGPNGEFVAKMRAVIVRQQWEK